MNTITSTNQNNSSVKSAGAQRVAAHRKKKKDMGLVPIYISAEIAKQIKYAGSFDAWCNSQSMDPNKLKKLNERIKYINKMSNLPSWKK